MSLEPKDIGDVRDTRYWDTKKIAEWRFESSLVTDSPLLEKLGQPVCVVNLEKPPSRGRKIDNVNEYEFVARSEWFGRRHEGIWARSISELKVKVKQAFADRIIAHSEVKWSDWIEVEIAGDRSSWLDDGEKKRRERRRDDATIDVKWKLLKRAKFPDGRDMVLDGSSLYKFPKAKAAGVDRDSGYHEYHQDSDNQYAYIPATPENLAAMETLVAKIYEVNDRLQAVLAQNAIAETTKLLTGGRLMLEKK